MQKLLAVIYRRHVPHITRMPRSLRKKFLTSQFRVYTLSVFQECGTGKSVKHNEFFAELNRREAIIGRRITQTELAEAIGISKSWVSQHMRWAEIPDRLVTALDSVCPVTEDAA